MRMKVMGGIADLSGTGSGLALRDDREQPASRRAEPKSFNPQRSHKSAEMRTNV